MTTTTSWNSQSEKLGTIALAEGKVARMNIVRLGLGLNFIGTLVVAAAGYFGLAAGFGGPIVWVNMLWPIAWWLGWLLVAAGFLLQWFGVRNR